MQYYSASQLEDLQLDRDEQSTEAPPPLALGGDAAPKAMAKPVALSTLHRYASIATHDLKAVTRHIGVFASFLREEAPAGSERQENAEHILQRVDMLDDMISGLRAFVESLELSPQIEPLSMRALALDAAAAVREAFREHDDLTTWRAQAPRLRIVGGAEAFGDRKLLRRAFYNVIENAALHSGLDVVELTLRLEARPDAIVARFSDNGGGVDPDKTDEMFTPFFKTVRRNEGPGLGVGLATCRNILQAHGGSIRFTPSESGGATVEMVIPRRGPRD